jgi:very-short-patch-repair endonuclease
MKFRRQHPLGIYTADFYCAEARLVIEVDGTHHFTEEGKDPPTEAFFDNSRSLKDIDRGR